MCIKAFAKVKNLTRVMVDLVEYQIISYIYAGVGCGKELGISGGGFS